ncbi:uncharacterized protein HRG_01836 [Hirsutella rhossiliensis]|uniref:non-specific serine/threonine protein kinase n=1 Tax=Hirsutella rhossiliensis TaxID=111463 RepID=A0A9P8N4G0_9HYPO|nr:uncharacterized protein HRG_01836 [Hirsutella rhossiliensis]KAH0966427.1 hypothetical protein HRG_01836 [Hirsutella rhossiliensis]
MSASPRIEYRWIDGVERLEMYEPGGFHPVMINDVLHNRYRVVAKLGYGGYSTIHDRRLNRYVAIKIGVSSLLCSPREPDILCRLSGSKSPAPALGPAGIAAEAIPAILDEFEVDGPNGTHPCYVTIPAQVARALAAKLILAVGFVHSQGFVHGDIHLRNVFDQAPVDIGSALGRSIQGQVRRARTAARQTGRWTPAPTQRPAPGCGAFDAG